MTTDGGHASLDDLAADAAGLLDPDRSHAITQHLAGCPSCTAAASHLAELGDQLAALPAPVIPEDVSQRVIAALRAEVAPATVLPLSNGKRRKGSPHGRGVAWAGVAAAAAAIALLSVVLVSHLSSSLSPSNTAAGSAAGAALAPTDGAAVAQLPHVVHATGTDYNSANLASQVRHNLAGSDISGSLTSAPSAPVAAPAPTDSSFTQGGAGAGNGSTNGSITSAAGPVPPQLKPLTVGTRLLACVNQLSGSSVVSLPLAVDLARFDGKPAAVVILPDRSHPSLDDAFVVTPACGQPQAGALLIYYQQVPAL